MTMFRIATLFLITLAATAAASSPTTQPASQPDVDWPAFHRGGALLGVAADGPVPPLKVRWTYRIDKAGIEGGAAIVGQSVYVADDAGGLHCIDLTTGQRRWLYKSEDGFATVPLVSAGRVFAGDKGGILHAVDAATGEKLWTYDSGDAINASANVTADGRILVANDGGKVACLLPGNGKPAWTASLERTNGAVAVAGDVGWVASCDDKLRSLDLGNGQVLQKIDLGSPTGASPVASDSGIIIGVNAAKVLCVDPDTAAVRWTFDKVGQDSFVYSSAAVADGVAVVGARDNNIYGLDAATGRQIWRFETQGEVDSSPAVVPGKEAIVYIGSKDGKLYALRLGDGRRLWQFDTGKQIASSPAVARGVLVFGDSGGNVYCLQAK